MLIHEALRQLVVVGLDDARRVSERGTLSLPDAAWTEAQRRALVIGPLAAQNAVSAAAACNAGRALGLSKRTIYALLRRWWQSGGLAAMLAPRPSPGGRSKGRLPATVERIIAEAIHGEYLTKQKKASEPRPGLFNTHADQFGCFVSLRRRNAPRPDPPGPWLPWRAADLVSLTPRCCP